MFLNSIKGTEVDSSNDTKIELDLVTSRRHNLNQKGSLLSENKLFLAFWLNEFTFN